MRFDLVDLQLFIAVADQRSITRGAERVHLALASASARIKGLEAALGVALLNRGRRGVELTAAGENLLDHARVILHQVETLRGDLAAYSSGVKASVLLLANTSGLSEHRRGRWRPSCANIPTSMSMSRSAKAPILRKRSRPVLWISVSPPSTLCLTISNGFCSAKTVWCWWRAGAARSPAAARSIFRRGWIATSSA